MMGDARDPREQYRHGLDEIAAAVRDVGEQAPRAARREVGRRWPRLVIANAIVTALVVVAGLAAGASILSGQAANSAAITALREQAEESAQEGDEANRALRQRGQPPVPIPRPGTAEDSEVIIAAATARVLASLPDPRPTPQQLGQAIAAYLAEHPIRPGRPTPQQLAEAVAGYLATNPPPKGEPGEPGERGEQGPRGEPGPPPTRDEIEAAFAAYLAEHPDALCPRGGRFAQISVVLADGGTADLWSCVVSTSPPPDDEPEPPPSSPPPSTSTTTPAPTSEHDPPPLLQIPGE